MIHNSVLLATLSARTSIAVCALIASLFLSGGLHPAVAQSTRELAGRISQVEQELENLRGAAGQAAVDMTPDAAASVQVRVLKLEQLLEQLTGQVEEARFRVGQMSTQLRQLSDDVNYRLAVIEQALGISGAVASGPGATTPQPRTPQQAQTSAPASAAQVSVARGDAPLSQPVSSQPGQATRSSTQISAGPVQDLVPDGQMVLRTDGQGQALPANPGEAPASISSNAPPPVAPAPLAAPNPGSVSANQLAALPPVNRVSLPDGTPKEQYEYAFNFLTRNDFASAEVALREFLTRHSEDPLAGNAQYWLGETYYVRGDYKQAAVEFMAGYQKYPRSNKGPDNLLKLGMSMAILEQAQGACTALNRIPKDYADASEQIRRTAEAQRADLQCK